MNENAPRVLVTGAASGLGRACVDLLSARGWQVLATDRDAEKLTALEGEGVTTADLDVAAAADWERVTQRLEPLQGLVNCAGISLRKGIEETSLAEWQQQLEVNLTGTFLAMKHCGPLLRAGAPAAVVNVSSIVATLGYFSAGYAATKWAVRGLSKVGAFEWRAEGVRVNSIHPGLIDTPLLHQSPDDSFVRASLSSVPAGRMAEPQEVAAAIAWLLSPESAYVNGTELVVDGGLTSTGLYHRILAEAQELRCSRS